MIVQDVRREDAPEVRHVENDHVVETFVRTDPITRSTNGFCQGDGGAVTTSSMPIDLTAAPKSSP
jgi:hypothetical protein